MRISKLSVLFILVSRPVFAQETITCTHYVYQTVPFITITMNVKPDGHIDRLSDLNHYGNTRQTAVEENPPNEGELYNLTIEADHPNSELFLEIYRQNTQQLNATFDAKLINPQSPAMREMLGQCEYTTSP